MSDTYTDRLSDYLDDEDLDAAARADIEAHLRGCAQCRRTLGELREVASIARALPDSPPDADLWPGVSGRLDSRVVAFPPRAPRRFSFTLPQLAAAALALMVLSGGMVWVWQIGGSRTDIPPVAAVLNPNGRPDTAAEPVPVPVRMTDAQYDDAVADLEKALDVGRGRLEPETIRVLETNLQAIDRAIEQCRRALSEDPGNAYLYSHLADNRQRKLALLRRATAIVDNEL